MGTNFYLRQKQPTVRRTIHIGKRSWGWLFHCDSCDESEYPRWCDEDPSAYQSDSLLMAAKGSRKKAWREVLAEVKADEGKQQE